MRLYQAFVVACLVLAGVGLGLVSFPRLQRQRWPSHPFLPPPLRGARLQPQTFPSAVAGAVLSGIGLLFGSRRKHYIKVKNDTGVNINVEVWSHDVMSRSIKEHINAQLAINPKDVKAAVDYAVEKVLLELSVKTWNAQTPAVSKAKKQSVPYFVGPSTTGSVFVTAVDPSNLNRAFCISYEVPTDDKLVITQQHWTRRLFWNWPSTRRS